MGRFRKSKTQTEPEVPKARVELQQQLLIPGIPNDVTLDHISPKLSISALQVLSSVSCAWCDAIKTREVHHSRVRNHSTEKEPFVLIRHSPLGKYVGVISLYSVRNNLCYELPPIPSSNCTECVLSSDWKVYVIPENDGGVFVLDLAGQWQWYKDKLIKRTEVWDSWVDRQPTVYDPVNDDWKSMEDLQSSMYAQRQFVTEGKFYCAGTGARLSVYDLETKAFTDLYEFSYDWPIGRGLCFWLPAVVAVEDELVAVVRWKDYKCKSWQTCLVRSRGFSSKNPKIVNGWNRIRLNERAPWKIVWERIDCSLPFPSLAEHVEKFVMHAFQL